MKRSSKSNRKIWHFLFTVTIGALAICGSLVAFSKSFNTTFNMIDENNMRQYHTAIKNLSIDISENTTVDTVADQLYDAEFIGSKFWFKIESLLYNDNFYPGTYTISNNMSNHSILNLLCSDPSKSQEAIQFTIPEGFTIVQIANRLEDKEIISKDEFLKAVNERTYDYDFLKDIPEDVPYKLEGYLFPDTYTVYPGVTGEEIILMMLNRFEEVTGKYTQYLYGSTYTLHDLLTIASIVEHEAKLSEERPTISGVIYNRLNENMKLQMCSTVQYALGSRKTQLSYEDLAVDSPYNTYLNTGLPIGPICNPGESALHAAFIPEVNDYFYFVLKDVTEGSHAFSQTGDEHARNKALYNQNDDVNFQD